VASRSTMALFVCELTVPVSVTTPILTSAFTPLSYLFCTSAACRFFSMPSSRSVSTFLPCFHFPGADGNLVGHNLRSGERLGDGFGLGLVPSVAVVPVSVITPLSRSWLTLTSFNPD